MLQSENSIKVVALNTFTSGGGAAIAAARINAGIQRAGADVRVITRSRITPRDKLYNHYIFCTEWLRGYIDFLPLKAYKHRKPHNFSINMVSDGLRNKIILHKSNIIHLHWICSGFVQIETLTRLNLPIIWTLHDSWPFTGGCHLPYDCERYKNSCGSCPILGSTSEQDLSRWVFKRKEHAWKNLDITVVSPSRWLAQCAQESSLFGGLRIEVIPNGLDLSTFRIIDKQAARSSLGLTGKTRLILFCGAHDLQDPNKGFQLLRSALDKLIKSSNGSNLELAIAGSKEQDDLPDLGVKTRQFGYIRDEYTLNRLYSAADVVVVPSQQENLPNTIMEAMASGTPCVAFNVGGVPDMIDHMQNGFLSLPNDARSLSEGIAWSLDLGEKHYQDLCRNARLKIESEFSIEQCAQKYINLYNELASNQEAFRKTFKQSTS